MDLNHALYQASNLGRFKDPSPSLLVDSYYPRVEDHGIPSSESRCSSLVNHSWDSFESQIPSSRSGSHHSTTTASSQEGYLALLQSHQKLEQEKLILEGKLNALEQAYSLLAQSLKPAVPNLPATIPALSSVKPEDLSIPLSIVPTAEREDYSLVTFWYRHEWNAAENNQVARIGAGAQGKTRAAQGENVTLRFVEDENGTIIDGFRATVMRRFARELWAGLNSIGKAPKTWGKVDAAVAAQYRNEMERKFPELRLCDNHWKSDFIATLNYPSWYNNNVEKQEHSKRASVDPPPDAKRPRVSAEDPVTPSIHPPPHKKRTKHSARIPVEGDSQSSAPGDFPSAEGPKVPGYDAHSPIQHVHDPPVGSRDPETHPRSRVKNPLFSVYPATANPGERIQQPIPTAPHVISMRSVESAAISQTEIPMAGIAVDQPTTMTPADGNTAAMLAADQVATMPTVDQTATIAVDQTATIAVDQAATIAVDQAAPTNSNTVSQKATVTGQTGMETSNPPSPTYPNTITGETPTVSAETFDMSLIEDSGDGAQGAKPRVLLNPIVPSVSTFDNLTTTSAALVSAPATVAPVEAPATEAPVNAPATVTVPSVGLGTGKKAGTMRPNPHSTTARNLCALDWKERNPHGSTSDFKEYYDNLSAEQKKHWKDREFSMKTVRAAPGASD